MTDRVIYIAEWKAARERAAIRQYMSGTYRPERRPTLDEIMGTGPWPRGGGDAA